MVDHKYDVIICVFACATIPKYREQILKIKETWYKRALEKNMLVLFFLGEEEVPDLVGSEYIYLKGVSNDYSSASIKQNLGIKWIIDSYSFDYIHVCGTDTFLVIDNLEKLVRKYEPTRNISIGGHGCHRTIDGKSTYFHSGGPGFLLSRSCSKLLYPHLENMYENWREKCSLQNNGHLIDACDVAMGYYLGGLLDTEMIKEDACFFHCTYYGYPCHMGQVDDTKIVACHLMSLMDFDNFQGILRSRNMARPTKDEPV